MYNNGNSSKNVTGASVVDGTMESADYPDNGLSGDKIDGGIISNFQSTGIDDRLANGIKITTTTTGANVTGSATATSYIKTEYQAGFAIGSVSGVPRVQTDSTGNMRFFNAGDTETVRFPSTGGITFNGDSAAANALDDYEEGTWAAALSVESGTTPTYTVTKATYIKIGRLVTCKVKIAITAAGSGLLRMTYPFVPAADQQLYGVANLKDSTNTYQGLTVVSYNNTYVYLRPDNSTVYYFKAQHLNTDLNLAFSFEV
jgi:hypothetical protein